MSFVRDRVRILRSARRTLVLEIPEPVGYHGWSFKPLKVKLHVNRGKVHVYQWDPSSGKWTDPEPGVIQTLKELGDLIAPFKL